MRGARTLLVITTYNIKYYVLCVNIIYIILYRHDNNIKINTEILNVQANYVSIIISLDAQSNNTITHAVYNYTA